MAFGSYSFMHYDLGYIDLEQRTLQRATARRHEAAPSLRYKL